ncbi:phospholipase/carboxylesterase [Hyphomonas adhaerens MHS-3]|uniref:Phospholipase/carboxylesterase n=1 Tax=Hyphomonas adhaerens MHS-3 TaxID=1280949 RepID=A0A069E0A0_9PROT|nr:phospholipase/carboxylesterase [Hyphomonas adhaerens MHS-3]
MPASASNVVYGTGPVAGGTKDLKLDVYQTGEACTDLRPFVMLIHGGGFEEGSKSMSPWRSIADDLTDLGYTAISIDYRMIGDTPRPSTEFRPLRDDIYRAGLGPLISYNEALQADAIASAIEDTVTAIRWVDANQDALCVDMSRFAVWGDSAGAIMGLHAAYGMDAYNIPVPEPDVVIDYWGRFITNGNLMTSGEPPAFILHGTQDDVVNYNFALDIRNQTNAAGIPYAFYSVTGGKHGFEEIPIDTLRVNGISLRQLTLDFVSDHLEGGSPGYETHLVPK